MCKFHYFKFSFLGLLFVQAAKQWHSRFNSRQQTFFIGHRFVSGKSASSHQKRYIWFYKLFILMRVSYFVFNIRLIVLLLNCYKIVMLICIEINNNKVFIIVSFGVCSPNKARLKDDL